MPAGTSLAAAGATSSPSAPFFLQKDPKKRPSAKALLEHRFFAEKAKKPDFLVKAMLEGIPALGDRVRELRDRENARRGAGDNDIKSQSQ